MKAIPIAAIFAGAGLLWALPQEITPNGSQAGTVTIRVNAARPSGFHIPLTIFGSFLEPIGNSTYNGLWAEILQNPSFENGLWDTRHVEQMIKDDPQLARASSLGLPLPWEPLDGREGNRYEPRRGDAANSWQSITIFGLPDRETGVRQQVYLPADRELQYRGSLYVKHLSGPEGIDISIRRRDRPDEVLARAHFIASSAEWQKYSFDLAIAQGKIAPLEPADFVIQVQGDERAIVDQASLMPADALAGLDPQIIAMAKAMHTPLVRFGGNYTSAYHWRDGIGPVDKRISMRNVAWGIPEYNQFGTDAFLHFCELIEAQPQIALNLGSGTPEEAAGWVRYVNEHWPAHGGLLWELGNELWGDWNLGYPTLQELPGRTLAFSKAVRQIDPHARLIATGQDPDHFQRWDDAELSEPPGTFDFLSTHFVVTTDRVASSEKTPDAVASATFALPVALARKLRDMQTQIDESPSFRKRAHIAFTEWLFVCCGGGNVDAPRWDNMGGAVTAGGFFNMLMRNADIVPISDMTGILEFAGIWKKRGQVFATPAYYVFKMYATAEPDVVLDLQNDSGTYNVQGGVTRLPDIKNVSYLDVVAAKNKAGNRITFFCVNRHLNKDIPAEVTVEGFEPRAEAGVQELYAPSIYEVNDEVHPDHIVPTMSTAEVKNSRLRFTFRHESITRIDFQRR